MMSRPIQNLKHLYRQKREQCTLWRRQNRPAEIRRCAALRLRAWRQPFAILEGIKLDRGTGLTVPIFKSIDDGRYELPEANIVRHALQPDDVVLKLGTGLGFISWPCARVVGCDNVYSFEANPALRPVILKNYQLNSLSPQLDISLLGETSGAIIFYFITGFWSSSTIKRHPRAKPIQVPMKCFNDELARIRPSFLIIDIEGGEHDFIRYASLDGVRKVCIELHPPVTGSWVVAKVEAFSSARDFSMSLHYPIPRTNSLYGTRVTEGFIDD
jgi:FkbM family methyltransferase